MLPALAALPGLPDTSLGAPHDEVSNDSLAREARGTPILKYNDPVLAKPHPGFDMAMGHDSLPQYVALYSATDEHSHHQRQRSPLTPARPGGIGAGSCGVRYKRQAGQSKDDITAILTAIVPNKEWTTDAGAWVQTVSSAEWSRGDLESLQNNVDERLATLQARPGAVCAVREQIFSELYDEVVREIILECPERGLLLLRLRDEARMNLETYAEIYRDSAIFSRRAAEAAREELESTRSTLTELRSHTIGLQAQVRSLEAELAVKNRSNAYAKATTEQHHSERLQVVRAEQKALESAIAKSQKKLREAAAAPASAS